MGAEAALVGAAVQVCEEQVRLAAVRRHLAAVGDLAGGLAHVRQRQGQSEGLAAHTQLGMDIDGQLTDGVLDAGEHPAHVVVHPDAEVGVGHVEAVGLGVGDAGTPGLGVDGPVACVGQRDHPGLDGVDVLARGQVVEV